MFHVEQACLRVWVFHVERWDGVLVRDWLASIASPSHFNQKQNLDPEWLQSQRGSFEAGLRRCSTWNVAERCSLDLGPMPARVGVL